MAINRQGSRVESTPLVAIVIVNWKNYEDTIECLNSLQHLTYPNFKIYLVDNESDQIQLGQLRDKFPTLHCLAQTENLGFTGGNNTGIKRAVEEESDCVLLLNNDTTVEHSFLDQLVSQLNESTELGAVQPKILQYSNQKKVWNAGGRINKNLMWAKTIGLGESDNKAYPRETDWITGCAMLVKKEVIDQVGMLNDRFFAYFEDVDWSLRIRNQGWQLELCSTAIVYHKEGSSSKSKAKGNEGFVSPYTHYLNIRNQLFLQRLHLSGIKMIIAIILSLIKYIGYLGYFTIRRRWKKLNSVLLGIRDGLLTPLK